LDAKRRKSPGSAGKSAYLTALTLLARRELSESQVRQRLARRGHAATDIDDAIDRLKSERAIDDARVAEAIARSQTSLKRRGKLRVRREIEAAGIASPTAARTVNDLFAEVDEAALLERALAKRLRGRERVTDQRELQRLYRYLISQGFEADRVSARLRKLQ